jgi:integrase
MAQRTVTRRRANGEGSIYPYRGRWRGAVAWIDGAGTQHRRQVSGKTQADVRAALDALRVSLDRGLAPAAPQTVGEFLTRWLEASRQRVRPATWRRAEEAVRVHLTPYLGRTPLGRLTPADVERTTAGLIESGRSPRTAQIARVTLRRALADAVRDGLVHRNVAALARPPHVPVRSLTAGRDYLLVEDLRRVIAASKVHPMGPLITVAALTGLRQGELLGLAWSDIDTGAATPTLTVRRSLARSWDGWALAEPKTARSRRTINLTPAGVAALDRQRSMQDAARAAAGSAWQDRDDLVFTDAVGRPMSGNRVTHEWHRLLDAAGLPSIPFHGLRHSAATALLADGKSLKVVSDMLGHSTITMTADRYAGVVPEQKREAAEAMERLLG